MKTFLVIPTIRNLDFLIEWKDEFKDCHLIVVEDRLNKEALIPINKFLSIRHYCWHDIKQEFEKKEWIFSRKNAGIRSYGFWKANELGADTIITLDDDCYPAEPGFVKKHIRNLSLSAPEKWFTTFPHPDFMYTRGYPYRVRNKFPVVVSHGLWSKVVDLDAKTQLKYKEINVGAYPEINQFIPKGYYFPMSSMNLAFKREAIPLMYFPLMGFDPDGKRWGFDRFDDIWAGVFAKKILDHLNLSVVNGSPFVEHRKASDPNINMQKEKTGLEVNEWLWKAVDEVRLNKDSIVECYLELAEKVVFPQKTYFNKLRKAMIVWGKLFL